LLLEISGSGIFGDALILPESQSHFAPAREGLMAKDFRTAEQLSDMIVSALHVKDVGVQVRKDHAYGWQPIVVSSPGDLIGYQRRVEEIANRLRIQFALRE
jgi:hypothetical protein